MNQATARAHPNIALVKYWGKRDTALNLPAVGSISITLDTLQTVTGVRFDESLQNDMFVLDGKSHKGETHRVVDSLDMMREIAGVKTFAEVHSANNFPTGSGLASSASGFAALVVAADAALGLNLDQNKLSELARRGSGSAARSILGGFVELHHGAKADGSDCVATPLLSAEQWPLAVTVAVVSREAKEISSTDGMEQTRRTSSYYKAWVDGAETDLALARAALKERDFQKLAEVSELSCLKMHALAMSAQPGLMYWHGATVEGIHRVRQLRKAGHAVFFTIDAGPQLKVVSLPGEVTAVKDALKDIDGVQEILRTGLGAGQPLTKHIASAPGKMILLGEFAVLDNAPAIVLALNRRAQVTVTSAESNYVSAPEVSEHDVRFEIDDNRNVTWVGVDSAERQRLGLLAQVISRFWPGYPVHIETDTSAFYEDGIKMGFGSSAALTVAASAALSGLKPPLDKLIETHCAAQDGRGSGFDIAASWHGGVIQYRKNPLEAEAMELPNGLHLRCIWTGQPASTKAFLRGLDALGERRTTMKALVDSATTEVARLDQSPASWVLAVQNYSQALKEFAAATTLPIYAGGHKEVAAIADNNRVAYKPSGAGGGDLGVAISDDPSAIQAFTDDLKATSVRVLRMDIDDEGLALN